MKQALMYSLKVWLTTIVAGPFIAILILSFLNPNTSHHLELFISLFYLTLGGIFFCLPSWLLFWLLAGFINKRELKMDYKKLFISIVSIFLSFIPFAIMDAHALFSPNYWPSELPWVASYFGVLITCIWFYKLKPTVAKELKL